MGAVASYRRPPLATDVGKTRHRVSPLYHESENPVRQRVRPRLAQPCETFGDGLCTGDASHNATTVPDDERSSRARHLSVQCDETQCTRRVLATPANRGNHPPARFCTPNASVCTLLVCGTQ